MKWATDYCRLYNIGVEYYDRTAVGYDESLKEKAPWNELIWHQGYFTCYSRDDLIREYAGKSGDFMAEVGLNQIYIHQYDGGDGGWPRRCSKCRETFPGEDVAELGRAQAHLANLYYDEIKARVPDLKFILVESKYDNSGMRLRNKPYHDMMDKLLNPEIIVIIRETDRKTVERCRAYYPRRALYSYLETDESTRWWPIFQFMPRHTMDYYFDDDRDIVYVSVPRVSRTLSLAAYAYYCWNVHAPGAETTPYRGWELNPRRDSEGLSREAEKALDAIARYEYGDQWGPRIVKASRTWLSPGLAGNPQYLRPNTWKWSRILLWFPELEGMPKKEAWVKLYEMQMQEAQRAEPLAEDLIAEPDYPDDAMHVYASVKMCAIMVEPRYWQARCELTQGPADYARGAEALKTARKEAETFYETIQDSFRAKLLIRNLEMEEGLASMEKFFKAGPGEMREE
jgi:hypothetical protein